MRTNSEALLPPMRVAAFALMPALGAAFFAPSAAPSLAGARSLGAWPAAAAPARCARARPLPIALRCAAGLDTWLADNGGKTVCGASPAGLVAQRDLKAGEEACSVSQKACLTADSARAAFGGIADTVDAETAIALQLLLERAKGGTSAWAPWVKTLPGRDELELPYFWPEADKRLLEGTTVGDAIEENQEALEEEFEQLVAQGWGDKFPKGVFTLTDYEWAVGLVSARAVYADKVPGNYILAPFVDAAFTGPPAAGKAEFYFDGMLRQPRVKVSVGAPGVKQGGVVGIDYGGKSRSKMLLKHGVCRTDAVAAEGSYEVSFSVSPMDKFRDDKLDILEINKMPEELTVEFSASDFLSADEIAFLRLVCLQGMDAFLLESVFRNEVWGFMQEPVSKENEKMVLETLIATCEGCLSGFTSTDAEDTKALAGGSAREQRAAAVRRAEKAALRNTVLILEEEIDSLEEKEYYQERRLRMLNLDRPVDEVRVRTRVHVSARARVCLPLPFIPRLGLL
jgi:[ribulose-bisphosphate carboxylase]-lysine N-methyltransferase